MTSAAHLLPPNASPLQRALSLAAARTLDIDAEVVARGSLAPQAPEALLPFLAWERSVDEWARGWTLAARRQVVGGSLAYHQLKGTAGALRRALAQISYQVAISEWFQHGGAPYTFRLQVSLPVNSTFTQQEAKAFIGLINRAKNARSLLDRLQLEARAQGEGPRVVAWGPRRARTVRLLPLAA